MGIAIGLVLLMFALALMVAKANHKEKQVGKDREVPFPVPGFLNTILVLGALVAMSHTVFKGAMFYAEPGFIYHVRTIMGKEIVVDSVGYNFSWFGRVNAWKKAMTVQAIEGSGGDNLENAEGDNGGTSATLDPLRIQFLDQVDAATSATARFRLPTDQDTFLSLAHEYRSPENFLRTALIPAFKETLHATGSLMTAEEYYAGGRTEFNNEFERQMADGIYIVKRMQKRVSDETINQDASANASKSDQDSFGSQEKVVSVVEKQYDDNGTLKRKKQKFVDFGVQVVEARITDTRPNQSFVKRMQLKQKASADRAIAKEQRIQEVEQRLLAIAKGDREVAERQAKAKVEQIQKTTEAETEKQLALTSASKLKEQAAIEKETAQLQLEKARIDAQRIKTLADAEAYQKKAVMQADNALDQKLQAEIAIQKVWAEAYAKRQVPATVFNSGGNGKGGVPVGSDTATMNFMQLMTLDAAKRLNYERDIKAK